MKSRLVKFVLFLIVIGLGLGAIIFLYGKQHSKQILRLMKTVYQHDPKFGIVENYSRITRITKNGDDWLVYNTWDLNDDRNHDMLDGEYFMVIQNGTVKDYQEGAVSFLLTDLFYCRGFSKNHKKRYWIFDERGNRTGCIELPEILKKH